MDQGPLRIPAPALLRWPQEDTMETRRKIGMTAAQVVALNLEASLGTPGV
jgi:hypothetical protein